MSKFKKGDVVDYRFEGFAGRGVVKNQSGPEIWDVLVEGEYSDVCCFRENIEHVSPPLNVFDLIKGKMNG